MLSFPGGFDPSRADLLAADALLPCLAFPQISLPGNGQVPDDSAALAVPSSALSPSLGSARGAFEWKFLVDAEQSRRVKEWAREHLAADPHLEGSLDDGYHVNNLYLDTPDFQTYRRRPYYRRRKFRLRRYGQEAILWLEVKRKHKGQVHKRRVSVDEAEFARQLAQPFDPAWGGAWFRRQLDRRGLRPVCQVTYCRFARVGISATGPIRLTIDSDLFAQGTADWLVPVAPLAGEPLLAGRQILELKFRDVLPVSFRDLIHQLRLESGAFSKYREGVAACIPLSVLTGEGG